MFLYDYCKREKNKYYVSSLGDVNWVIVLIVCQICKMFMILWLG